MNKRHPMEVARKALAADALDADVVRLAAIVRADRRRVLRLLRDTNRRMQDAREKPFHDPEHRRLYRAGADALATMLTTELKRWEEE